MTEIQKINSVLRTVAAQELEKAVAIELEAVEDGDLEQLLAAQEEKRDGRENTENN
jgi:hypothetical protein